MGIENLQRQVMKRLLKMVCGLLFFLVAVSVVPASVQGQGHQPVFPTGFSSELVLSGLSSPTTIAFAPDGRMFIAQKDGVVRVFHNDQLLPDPFIDISSEVNAWWDRGLLGITIHPDFPNTPYVYLLHTYEPNTCCESGQRVSRLMRVSADPANLNAALPGSEEIILGKNSTLANIPNPFSEALGDPPACDDNGTPVEDCLPSEGLTHSIGTVVFASDGSLFVSNGEGAQPTGVDVRALRAQDLDSLAGKILRIDPITGLGLPDNPFYDGDPTHNRSKVYSFGLRNPFRMALHPTTDEPFIGDVGWSTWEEINSGRGANFGWPCYEGGDGVDLQQPSYAGDASTQPICQALYDADAIDDSTVTAPIHAYNHNGGGASVQAGAFYTGNSYPAEYQGALFFEDYNNDWMNYLSFDVSGNATVNTFATNVSPEGGPVQIITGPDTNLYYVVFNGINNSEIRRIVYQVDNTAPSAQIEATPTSGQPPLTVDFSSDNSYDPDGDPITYEWNFGDGTTSTLANPSHTYNTIGTYSAVLTVTDTEGSTNAASITITVGNTAPEANIVAPAAGATYSVGDTILFEGEATDAEEGSLTGDALEWELLLHHEDHLHFDGMPAGTTGTSGSFVAPDHGDDTALELCLNVTDSGGLTGYDCMFLAPNLVQYTFDTVPSGLVLVYTGVAYTTPFTVDTTINSQQVIYAPPLQQGYEYKSWSDGGDPSHTITIGAGPQTVTASYEKLPRVADGQQVLYTFAEGSGTTVTDVSGSGSPLNLTIEDEATVSWLPGGGLSLDSSTVISSGGAATKVNNALLASGEVSVEAWVKAGNLTQFGPARIVALSVDGYPNGGNLMLGQSTDTIQGRLRTSATSIYGTPSTDSPANSLDTDLTQVIYTRDSSGATHLYLDTVEVANGNVAGGFSNWAPNVPLTLGNEPQGNRSWLGDLHLVAIYDRALSQDEVQQNYDAGIDIPPPEPPTISGQPQNETVLDGETAIFNVQASGTAPLNYQWQEWDGAGWAAIGGATSASHSVAATLAEDGARLRCVVSNNEGSATSDEAILTVLPAPPAVTSQPQNQTVAEGETATFTIAANGSAPLSYQWQQWDGASFVDIGGATNAGYTTAVTTLSDDGSRFRCVVSNGAGGVTSGEATLTVQPAAPPAVAISITPASQTLDSGNDAIFTFDVDNSGGVPLSNVTISDAQCDSLTLDSGDENGDSTLQTAESWRYTCIVNNVTADFSLTATVSGDPPAGGAVNDSATATVTINIAPPRVTAGQQVLYTFGEGQGTTVADVSGVGTPLDLTIEDEGTVSWLPGGGLSLDSSAVIGSGGPAAKVLDALQASGEVSVEAWVKAANLAQLGPARIVALTIDGYPNGGNVMLGQTNNMIQARLRTTVTSAYGTPSLDSPAGSLDTELTQVVYTRDSSGATHLYFDGAEVANGNTGGDFGSWAANVPLTLGNEPQGNRPWLGELHLVAIYDRALDGSEVQQNFDAGLVTVPSGPSVTITEPAEGATILGNEVTVSWTTGGELAAGDHVHLTLDATPPHITVMELNGSYTFSGLASGPHSVGIGVASSDHVVYTNPQASDVVNFTTEIIIPPVVTGQPQDETVVDGETATFSVTASGTAPLSYQWQQWNGAAFADIGGATSASYTTAALTLGDDGARLRCVVSNGAGSATSDEALLTVQPAPPAITGQPQDATIIEGETAKFSVTANGTAPLGYQWQRWDGAAFADISGATNASYATAAAVLGDDGARLRCVVSNGAGSATSDEALLTVQAPPPPAISIAITPANQTVESGDDASFTFLVDNIGGDALSNISISDAQCDSLILDSGDGNGDGILQTAESWHYSCVVNNVTADFSLTATVSGDPPAGSAVTDSGAATVTVNVAPPRTTDGLQVLYTFKEGAGSAVADVSGAGAPLDLTIADEGTVSWLPGGGLSLDSSTVIGSGGPATKVNDALQASGEVSVEAWVKAANLTQYGPARIVALSVDGYPVGGNVVLGQSSGTIEGRLRTTATSVYGTPSLSSAAGSLDTELLHVVYTRNGSGATYLYFDGVEAAGGNTAGSFSNWAANVPLTLGNEPPGNRPWLGELHLVAIYDRALNSAEVLQNFDAGLYIPPPEPPAISSQPQNETVLDGETATFSVTASGTAPLSYQWQQWDGASWVDIEGAISAGYAKSATLADDGARLRCVVSNGAGSATSDEAILTVQPAPPAVTGQPLNETIIEGETATFNVTASGSAPLSYQWQRWDGSAFADISGATNASYTTAAATLADDGARFRCVVSNGAGSTTSDEATLTVQPPPPPGISIAITPADQLVISGDDAVFTFLVDNIGGEALSNIAISDASCDSLVLDSGDGNGDGILQTAESWSYACVVNSVTADFSLTATVSGDPPAGGSVNDSASATVTISVAPPRVTSGLQALYNFEEGSGITVRDVSGAGAPLDLTIADEGTVSWLPGGGLSLDSSTVISSGRPATKVNDALQISGEVSVEAWVKAANLTQYGPARIVALSVDGYPVGGNVVLGQSADVFEARLRTTATSVYGTPSLSSPPGSTETELTQLVYTRDSGGATHIYLDGVEVASGNVAGSFSNWAANVPLTLGNEPPGNRPWLGELHLVAIYDRALDENEILQNLLAGYNLPPGSDPNLDVEIGAGNSHVILQNSLIEVHYEPYTAGHAQFAIRRFYIKSEGDQNQVGDLALTHQYLDSATGRGTLDSAEILYDEADRKTVRLVWNHDDNPFFKIIHEVSIYPFSSYIQVDYVDIQYGINIVDNGQPGGSLNGEHYAYGGDSWIRGYVTHDYAPTVGSYYNRYEADNVNDPADGGSLNCNGNFVFGVFSGNGVGFGRVMPVADISVLKLLVTGSERRGLEMNAYPFFLPHDPFTGYLFALTNGANEIDSIAAQGLPNGPAPCP